MTTTRTTTEQSAAADLQRAHKEARRVATAALNDEPALTPPPYLVTHRIAGAAADVVWSIAYQAGVDAQERSWRDLADSMVWHLDVEHRVRKMHDSLGANLGCSGCALLERLEAATEPVEVGGPVDGLPAS